MANAAKSKGDRAEREAVTVLQELAPNLCVDKAMRMLGAGRMDDVGDLRVFDDVAIQVRNYAPSRLGIAVRSAARDAVRQADNGGVPRAVGMVPIPRARKGTVRWLAAATEWPAPLWFDDGLVYPERFKMISRAITWLRDEEGTYDRPAITRDLRVASLTEPDGSVIYLAPIEAWLRAYSEQRGEPLVAEPDVVFPTPHEETQRTETETDLASHIL